MENNQNYARFKISENELEISGPVDFVRDQLQDSKNIIDFFAESIKHKIASKTLQSLSNSKEIPQLPTSSITENIEAGLKGPDDYAEFVEVKESDTILNKYSEVLAKNGGKLQILVDIPGNSQPIRMINIILIYLYWKLKTYSIEKISFGDLRAVCEMHGDLDAKHFAAYMKKYKKWFLIDGSGKSLSAKITIPGMKEAERLLDSMK
jgi:hypothetical protein